jgi:hypothetical protein
MAKLLKGRLSMMILTSQIMGPFPNYSHLTKIMNVRGILPTHSSFKVEVCGA